MTLEEGLGADQRLSEMVPSADALEAKRMQKMYSQLRKQASGGSSSSVGLTSPQHQRLDDWLQELESRQQQLKKYGSLFSVTLVQISQRYCTL